MMIIDIVTGLWDRSDPVHMKCGFNYIEHKSQIVW